MDTSIIVVIAIAVVFVVVVPTMILRSAKELSRADVDTVPADARVIAAEVTTTCLDHTGRPRVFHDDATVEATLPRAQATTRDESMELRLSAQGPELSLIAGQAGAGADRDAAIGVDGAASAEGADSDVDGADVDSADFDGAEEQALPIAVGQSHLITSLTSDDARHSVHATIAGEVPNNVHTLRPLSPVATAAQLSEHTGGGSRATSGRDSHGQQSSGPRIRSVEPVPIQSARGARGRLPQKAAGIAQTTGVTDRTVPRAQADEDRSMTDRDTTEEETTLRNSLRPLGTMIRGFAALLLGSLAGILVSGVLAIFSVVHPALMLVFAGLTVVSVIMVRTLNFRKRDIKRRLRELERASHRPTKKSARRRSASGAADAGSARRAAPSAKSASSASSAVSSTSPAASTARATRTERVPAAHRPTSSGIAARIAAAADSNAAVRAAARTAARAEQGAHESASTTHGRDAAARSRHAAAHSRDAAARSREEAVTGEIPIVHIRNEASAGHTTRQVLLTGPIPIIPDPADAEAAQAEAAQEPTAAAESTAAADETATSASIDSRTEATAGSASADGAAATDAAVDSADAVEATSAPTAGHLGADLDLGTAATSASAAEPAADDAAEIADPFMQRLQARGGWLPTPLPVPSYVDAPVAEHAPAQSAPADAASYTIETRTREEIAAQFAAELGYRPELSDHSREDGPLGHGRKAIRTTKAPELAAIDDVLARRRA